MKKYGFTLAEVLISLGIVGIATALVIPLTNQIRPDKYKTKVLNYYAAISKATNSLLDNYAIYYPITTDGSAMYIIADDGSSITPGCIGLRCNQQPLIAPYNTDDTYTDSNGNDKYRNLMRDMLSLTDTNGILSDPKGTTMTFIRVNNDGELDYYIIELDVNPNNNGSNCSFKNTTCTKPDRFVFKVSYTGDISPYDALTATYIQNPTEKRRSVDFENARVLRENNSEYRN